MDISALVVDDSSLARKIMIGVLEEMGVSHIDKAGDGATALTMIDNRNYDIVLLDWNMPRLNGLDVLKAVRNDPQSRETPIIMITAEMLKENIVTALQVGVNDYVVKPYDNEVLKTKILNVLEKTGKTPKV